MIKVNKVKPLFNNIITTADKYEEDQMAGGIIAIQKGEIKEFQKVIAVGSSVRDVKEGDLIKLRFDRFFVKKHKQGSMIDGVIQDNPVVNVSVPAVFINNQQCLMINDVDVEYIVLDSEEVEDCKIVVPENKIVVADPALVDTKRLR